MKYENHIFGFKSNGFGCKIWICFNVVYLQRHKSNFKDILLSLNIFLGTNFLSQYKTGLQDDATHVSLNTCLPLRRVGLEPSTIRARSAILHMSLRYLCSRVKIYQSFLSDEQNFVDLRAYKLCLCLTKNGFLCFSAGASHLLDVKTQE